MLSDLTQPQHNVVEEVLFFMNLFGNACVFVVVVAAVTENRMCERRM